jgi:Xaa-Pro aminopeptidase
LDREIIDRLATKIREAGLDAMIAISPENVTYVSGFVVPSQSLMRWRHAICIVTADGRVSMVAIDMEATTVRAHAGIDDVRIYREFTDDPMDKLAHVLGDLKLDRAKVGLELEYIPARDFETLRTRVPGIQWEPADQLFSKARQVKTAGELELLRSLSKLTDRAIGGALRSARIGMTELELAGHLLSGLFGGGAESYKLMIIASGERSEFPNVGPSARKLQHGDLIRMEIFGQKNGYLAGICRTAVIGGATSEQEKIWSNLIQCKYLVMDMIRPGAHCKAIYETFLKKFSELGFEPISFVGHGIGLHLHEDPYLGPTDDQPLEAGMVLGIEPLIYETGFGFGMQNKDMVLVTPDGCELLSDYLGTDKLMIVG